MFGGEKDDALSSVLELLPGRLAFAVERHTAGRTVEELRLRSSKPVQIVYSDGEEILDTAAFSAEEARDLLDRLCKHSVYAYAEELKNGYITLENGARVGVCGRPAIQNGSISGMTSVSCFNIRIARQVPGCAKDVIRFLRESDCPISALIASPPGGGKTTLLRDIARCLSEGTDMPPLKVAVADERGEIAACVGGVPRFDVGRRTDVMDRAPKAESIGLFIRSMSPDVIITDEIGDKGDAEAVAEAARCGSAVIASAHASGMEELLNRSCTAKLLKDRVFKKVLLIKRNGSMLRIAPVTV